MPIKRARTIALCLLFLILGATALPTDDEYYPRWVSAPSARPSSTWSYQASPSASLSSSHKREREIAQLLMERPGGAKLGGAKIRQKLLGLCSQKGQVRCPAPGGFGTECIFIMSDLESCGGCSVPDSFGFADGTDCTTLENVEAVRCVRGRCQIDSCAHGYTLGNSDGNSDGQLECLEIQGTI